MELLKKRLANLLCIKSLVTIAVTAVFSVLTLRGEVSGEQFLTIFSVIIAFYFGTQAVRTGLVETAPTSSEKTGGGEAK